MIQVVRLDHLVLTVKDIDATINFYEKVLGMEPVTFGDSRKALQFGSQKINLHRAGHELELKANKPVPGSADLCFIVQNSLEYIRAHLETVGIAMIEGPVRRTGALGPIDSIYIRDPDLNLIEISTQTETV